MKMHVHFNKPQPWVVPITVVCLALGILLALMVNVTPEGNAVDLATLSREALQQRLAEVAREKTAAEQSVRELQDKVNKMVDDMAGEHTRAGALQEEINQLRAYAGTTSMEGPGIVVTIDDSDVNKVPPADMSASALLIHDVDLLQVVNELRAAGAEAIAINDQRLGANTAVRCVGPTIQVNTRAVSAPFTIRAIGRPDALFGAVNLPLGIVDQLKQLGIKVTAAKRDVVRVPALSSLPPLEVGKVVTPKE
jgi:uncharacterized protein YlxW (UPF0749 family)